MANDIGTKMVAAWNSGNVDRIVENYAPAAVMHHPLVPLPLQGRDAIRSPFRQNQLHNRFSPAGGRNGGAGVIRVAAAADQRGIAKPPGSLVQRASGGSCGGDVACGVECDCAHCVVGYVRREEIVAVLR